ncbi:MAG: hypothetical protein IJN88_02825 [Clostridia bacterium]|nr:hypothetical protein [Clostridia bacterium]
MKRQSAKLKIEKAYFDLLETTHYSKITVSDIIRKAEISRTTFYRHYVDIFDMHHKVSDKLAYCIIEECAGLIMTARSEQDYFDEVLKIFNTQEKYILLISSENGSRYFFESMLRCSQELVSRIFSHCNEEFLFRLRFITVAMIGVYVRDVLEGREHNPDYIKLCKKLINYDELSGGLYAGKC